MEQQSGWPEYLGALKDYLRTVSRSLDRGRAVVVPTLLASRPAGAVPAEHTERAAALLAETERGGGPGEEPDRECAVLYEIDRRPPPHRAIQSQRPRRLRVVMSLPGSDDAVAAGRAADLGAVAAVVGEPLPPLFRSRWPTESLRIVYLMPRTGVGGGARVLLEHANHLCLLGASVTVVSHFPRPDWFDLVADFVEVPFGHPLCQSVPPCDVIVAGYWDEIVPACRLGIAPVVHFEQGDFHLYDEVPADLKPVVEASLGAADCTITVGEAAENALAGRYGVFAHRIANAVDAEVFHPLSGARSKRARRLRRVGRDRIQGD